MRILFLLTQDLESPSGLGRYWPLARELARLGHQVRIAALHSDFSSLDARQQNLDGVEVHYVAPMHVIKTGNQKSYYRPHQLVWITLRAIWALSWAALKYPVDIIYVGKPHPMNSIAGLLVKALRHVSMIVDCDDYEAGSGRFSGQWQKDIIEFFEKRVPRYGKMVTTHTHFMRDNLISWGVPKEKIVYLPNGVDPGRFSPPDPKRVETERASLKLYEKKVVAYIGSLSLPSHPVNLLVEAFAHIHAAIPDTVLMIVGGGEDMIHLKTQATERGIESAIRFVGRVSPEDVPLYYALADVSTDPIYDNPAARGRSPLKLYESWICGIPFVTADVGDRAYLMGDPPAGVLVRPGDAESLAEAILQVLNDPAAAEAYRQRGLARIENYYWDRLVRPLNDIYLEKV
ncbi:MAG: glycosyltransferase family 4 protein [Chloroflexi bacterium]|nr:glycosyltransferase family 4 protein [Chloroflexota bacterium]MBU1662795.1 glycosyltransferase family 4 protein [Chloroflexota bacterium]